MTNSNSLFLIVCFLFTSFAVTAQIDITLIKTLSADTIDVSELVKGGATVKFELGVEGVEGIRIEQTAKVLNNSNINIINQLNKSGYFSYNYTGTSNNLVVSDHSEKTITISGTDLEIERTYTVSVPAGKVVVYN